jgi:hypothetical protein
VLVHEWSLTLIIEWILPAIRRRLKRVSIHDDQLAGENSAFVSAFSRLRGLLRVSTLALAAKPPSEHDNRRINLLGAHHDEKRRNIITHCKLQVSTDQPIILRVLSLVEYLSTHSTGLTMGAAMTKNSAERKKRVGLAKRMVGMG